jgi:integrase
VEVLPNYLTEAEAREALRLAQRHGLYCEVCVALNTGLRMSELRRLQWGDVDLPARSLVVRMSKGRRPRSVPLNQSALKALRHQQRRFGHLPYVFPGGRDCRGKADAGGTWRRTQMRGLDWWTRKALLPLRVAIPKFSLAPKGSVGRGWHLFRHTFASRLVQAGISIYKVSSWLGHASVRTTGMYAHLASGYDEEIELGGNQGERK